MNKFIIQLIAVLCVFSNMSQAMEDGVAASVNHAIITEQDVMSQMRLIGRQFKQKLPEHILHQRALSDLIEQQAKMQYAQRYTTSPEEIDAAFKRLAVLNNMTPLELEKANVGAESALYNKLKVQVLWDKVIRQEIIGNIDIGTSEIDRTLKDMLGENATNEIELGQIISRSASETARIQDLLNKGVSAKNFDIIVDKAQDSASSERKGYLGWITRESLALDVQEALSSSKSGDVVGPLAMANGHYQWLKIYRTRTTPTVSFDPIDFVRLAQITLDDSAQKRIATSDNWQTWPLARWQEEEGVTVLNQGWHAAEKQLKVSSQTINQVPQNLLETGKGLIVLARKQDMSPQLLKMRERVESRLVDNRARMLERQLVRKIKSKAFVDIK